MDTVLAEALEEYEFVGLRVEAEAVEPGLILPPSRVWIDGEPTDDRLSGTSAINAREAGVEALAGYMGGYIVLLVADIAEYGEDRHEIVMRDARVVACWAR